MVKTKNQDELEQRIGELTLDLQRTRADFENYRKRVEQEKTAARANGHASAIMKFLPMVDNIDRALSHMPEHLRADPWATSVAKLAKMLEKSLSDMNVERIVAVQGAAFNPELHDAIQFEEDAEGEHEVIAQVLQPGYMVGGSVVRPAMVKVTRH